MKNSSMYTALAALIAFVVAVAYAILYFLSYLPVVTQFAEIGRYLALIVFGVSAINLSMCGCKCKHNFQNAFGCFDTPLVVSAAALLFFASLNLCQTPGTTIRYVIILFLLMFFWTLTAILWGLVLVNAAPNGCFLDSCGCDNANSNGGCSNTCAVNNDIPNTPYGYTNDTYKY